MSHKISGIVKRVGNLNQVSDRFAKRSLVITTVEQYPQVLEFEFQQDRVSMLDSIKPQDSVEVNFDLRGREWDPQDGREVKVFNTLVGWKIVKNQDAVAPPVDDDDPF